MAQYSLSRHATILSGQSESDVIDTEIHSFIAVMFPAAWTPANVTFLGSDTKDGTFLPVFQDDGTEVEITADVNQIVGVTGSKAEALASVRFIKLRSGTSTLPVNQGSDRVLKVLIK